MWAVALLVYPKAASCCFIWWSSFSPQKQTRVTLLMASQWNCYMGTHGCLGECSKSKKSDTQLIFWYKFQPGSPVMWCWHHTTKRRDTKGSGKDCFGRRSILLPAQVKHETKGQMTSKDWIRKDMPSWFIVVMVLPWSKYLLVRRGGKDGEEQYLGVSFQDSELSCLHCKKCLSPHRGSISSIIVL